MAGTTKLMTAGGGGVSLTPASSIASDVTVNVPSQNCTLDIQGPAFSAYLASGTQAISNASNTKITINTEEFDTNNCFDSTTNYRFTPTVAGYYQINGAVSFPTAGSGVAQLHLFKNGSLYKRGNGIPLNSGNGLNLVMSNVVYFNGSSDYVELFCFQNSGGSLNINGSLDTTYFNGSMVRAA